MNDAQQIDAHLTKTVEAQGRIERSFNAIHLAAADAFKADGMPEGLATHLSFDLADTAISEIIKAVEDHTGQHLMPTARAVILSNPQVVRAVTDRIVELALTNRRYREIKRENTKALLANESARSASDTFARVQREGIPGTAHATEAAHQLNLNADGHSSHVGKEALYTGVAPADVERQHADPVKTMARNSEGKLVDEKVLDRARDKAVELATHGHQSGPAKRRKKRGK